MLLVLHYRCGISHLFEGQKTLVSAVEEEVHV